MVKHTQIDSMMNVLYNNSCQGDELYIPEHSFWDCNSSIFLKLFFLPFPRPISLSREYHPLEVEVIVSQLPWQWLLYSKWGFRYFPHWPIGLYCQVHVIVLEAVSQPCADERILLPYLTVCTQHKLSWGEKCLEKRKTGLEADIYYLPVVDLLSLRDVLPCPLEWEFGDTEWMETRMRLLFKGFDLTVVGMFCRPKYAGCLFWSSEMILWYGLTEVLNWGITAARRGYRSYWCGQHHYS
jgi:hypothetical protein